MKVTAFALVASTIMVSVISISEASDPPNGSTIEIQPLVSGNLHRSPPVGNLESPEKLPVVETDQKIKVEPVTAYLDHSREAWKNYRDALRAANKGLAESLKKINEDLKNQLVSFCEDARDAIRNSKVKDACAVSHLKWQEVVALSVKAVSDSCQAKNEAWQTYCKARALARDTRNKCLENERGSLKNSR